MARPSKFWLDLWELDKILEETNREIDMAEPETRNKFLVSASAADPPTIIVQRLPCGGMSTADALNLAAWLVLVAGARDEFNKLVDRILADN